MEPDLLGHLLEANDPDTERAVADRLATDPAADRELDRLRAALAPLETDRIDFEPMPDLWVRTLARVAGHVVATEGPVARPEDAHTDELIRRAAAIAQPAPKSPPTLTPIKPAPRVSEAGLPLARRWNAIAVVGLSLSLLALIVPAVMNVRAKAQQIACQNGMKDFFGAVATYTDTNEGKFPRVPDGQPASAAAVELREAGYLPPEIRFTCPSAPPDATAPVALATYAYTLGFRDPSGELHGLDKSPGYDLMPILADAPGRNGSTTYPVNHRRGQNVLFAGGNVRFCTTSTVGIDADDIFTNYVGGVGAGLSRNDTVLGRPDERP